MSFEEATKQAKAASLKSLKSGEVIELDSSPELGDGGGKMPPRDRRALAPPRLPKVKETDSRVINLDASPLRVKAPPDWPICLPRWEASAKTIGSKKASGAKKIYERIEKRNAAHMHLKVKKKKMTHKMKIERKRAVATAKVLREEKPNAEEIAKDIANASGVSASQLTQYADGKVRDVDGDYFMSQEGV